MLSIIAYDIVNMNYGIAVALILISILICVFILYKNEEKRENNKKQEEQEFTFFFYNDHVTIKGKEGKSKYNYKKIYRVYETKTNFYLYVNNDYSLLINKEGFYGSNEREFRDFIKKKFIFKYRKIK